MWGTRSGWVPRAPVSRRKSRRRRPWASPRAPERSPSTRGPRRRRCAPRRASLDPWRGQTVSLKRLHTGWCDCEGWGGSKTHILNVPRAGDVQRGSVVRSCDSMPSAVRWFVWTALQCVCHFTMSTGTPTQGLSGTRGSYETPAAMVAAPSRGGTNTTLSVPGSVWQTCRVPLSVMADSHS